MEIKFNSLEELFAFVDQIRPREVHKVSNEGDFASTLFKIARGTIDGTKIPAIKAFRAATGHGLRESKDAIDRAWR